MARLARSLRPRTSAIVEILELRQLLSAAVYDTVAPARLTPLSVKTAATALGAISRRVSSAVAASTQAHLNVAFPNRQGKASKIIPHNSSPIGSGFNPTQIRHAYGMDQVMFGSVAGNGAGQTIAIIDAYDYPTALGDLQAFDAAFGLPDPPSFTKVSQTGSSTLPGTDPAGAGASNGTWEMEESLDIEWAHAMAPMANLILVEANSPSTANLETAAVGWAKAQPGVSVISMSFGGGEASGETASDSAFTTPSGHAGITFVASTGDAGNPGGYPAFSPNVVAVGGTSLFLSNGNYSSESGWSGSGGGISTQENKPSYQSSVTQSSTRRTTPDVSLDANPATGVAIYDSYDFGSSPWIQIGGTSLAAPMFAGVVAVADEGRALVGLASLDGPSQTLPAIYSIPAADFHDVTTGSNGSTSAGVGYDLVTGRGTPVGMSFVQDLAGIGAVSGRVYEDRNSNGVFDAGDTALSGVTVFADANNNGVLDAGQNATIASGTLNANIPDNNVNGVSSSLNVSLAGTVSDVNVTLNIAHTSDRDLKVMLIGQDGTTITLVSGAGGSSDNFTNTVFDDSGTLAISAGSAPFSHTYKPAGSLSMFNGRLAAGTWTLKVIDSRTGNTGTLQNWSLSIVTAGEKSTVTAADGSYSLNLPAGATTVRAVTDEAPAASSAASYALTVKQTQSGKDFAVFPASFAAATPGTTYYLWLDPTHTNVEIGTSPNAATYSVAAANASALVFSLSGANSKVVVDFSNGSPLPAGGITVDGNNVDTSELEVIGQSEQPLTMTDTQIGPSAGGPVITYQNLSTMTLGNATVYYSGSLSTLQNLNIDSGTVFYWG